MTKPDWAAKKPATYCRPHGKRIVAWVNGIGLCDTCETALYEFLYSDESDLEDDCGCYQHVGQPPHLCEKHTAKLAARPC